MPEEVKKKLEEEKKKKDPLEVSGLLPMLDPGILTGEDEGDKKPRLLAKPGHWMTTVQLMKANYEDFVGETTLEIGRPVGRRRLPCVRPTSR